MQEVDNLGGSDREVGPADLARMPYLEACLKEAMRLYPPGVFTMRQPQTEDFTVKGYTIPKGTWIHVSISLSTLNLHLERMMHDCMHFRLESRGSGLDQSVRPLLSHLYTPTGRVPLQCHDEELLDAGKTDG